MVKKVYPDDVFGKIIEALIAIRHSGTHDTYMEFFGSHLTHLNLTYLHLLIDLLSFYIGHSFVGFFSNYGFEKMLRVAGRSFRHFLHSIDQLHDSNRYSFPSMKSPLFFVGAEDLHGCFLHYQ
jgi:hypothetical protein